MGTKTESRVVQCNYREGTPACQPGSRVYLSHSLDMTDRRLRVVARSRSGRWVVVWEKLRNLTNFRMKTLAADDPLARRHDLPIARNYWTQQTVENLNAAHEE